MTTSAPSPVLTTTGRPPMPRRRRRRRRPVSTRVVAAISIVVVLGVWQLVGPHVNPLFVSYPSAIAKSFWQMVANGTLPSALGSTMQPLAAGFVLAVVIGVPLGLAMGTWPVVRAAVGPYVMAGQATPTVALLPLFVVWFGLGFVVKVAIVLTMSVFAIIINTWNGVEVTQGSLLEVGEAFGLSRFAILRKITVPAVVPFVISGLRVAIGRAIVGVIIAEFYTALGGIGGILVNAGDSFDTPRLFAGVVTLMILGTVLTYGLGFVERKVAPWQAELSGRAR